MAKTKTALGSRWMSVTDVTTKLKEARQNREEQVAYLKTLNTDLERKLDDLAGSLGDLPEDARQKILNRARGGIRADFKRNSAERRLRHMKKAGAIQEATNSARPHYQSAVQMLMRDNLGSERRSRLLDQTAHSGSAELVSLAELAAATDDKELAAVLISRNAELKVKDRPFSSQQLADALVGEEFNQMQGALAEIDRLTQEVAHDDTAFETGRSNPRRAVKIALMKQAEAELELEE